MRLLFLPAIVAAGCLFSSASQAQNAAYFPGTIVVRAPMTVVWPHPAIRTIFEAHPLDDGYDYPFGYGEYAVYGRWAVGLNCYILRGKIPTSLGYRWRQIRACD